MEAEKGNFVVADAGKTQVIGVYWENQFTREDDPLQAFNFIGDERCLASRQRSSPINVLDTPITCNEVKKAAKALKNNKATGPDKGYNTPYTLSNANARLFWIVLLKLDVQTTISGWSDSS